ncbi:hypothetical protein, unknown function [Leishmania tarentolae]|uniref:Ch36-1190 protein n=1 Tax=Leishmania tarentolae TaxID=5689 RepID=A0A640KUY2_LEITA|nr:hypothetical protein, unknown function [Leishmania tarentolae]
MRYWHPRHGRGGRRDCVSLTLVLGVLFLLAASMKGGMAKKGRNDHEAVGPFGPLVHSLTTIQSFHHRLTYTLNPLVLFLFDRDESEVTHFWMPLLKSLSKGFDAFGIEVAEATRSSETGQQLFGPPDANPGPFILFFQGVSDTPGGSGEALKMPMAYEGKLDMKHIMTWGVSCISSSVTHRVHNDVDLALFFAQYPQYPALPHVLYFPSRNYTPAGYLTISQHFSRDAVFGVVPNAFSSPNATRIAQRYNITSKDELPVLLVLHRASADDANGAGESDRVVRMPTVPKSFSYSQVLGFLSTHITDTIEDLMAKAMSTESKRLLEVAERRRSYMVQQLIERQLDVAEEERLQKAREPIFVKDQKVWAKHCLHLRKDHRCLAAFIDSTQDPASKDSVGRILSLVSVKLLEVMGQEAQKVSLVIVDRQGSDAVREYFDVGHNGFPDVLFLSFDRPAKYYNFVGTFSAEGVTQFVVSHDARLAKKEVRGGHTFIPRMTPNLEDAVAVSHNGNEEEGDL